MKNVTRRGFIKSIGASFGVMMAAGTPLISLLGDQPKQLVADTAKKAAPAKKTEPAKRGGATIRKVSLPDGTTFMISDWGDYPMYSRATYTAGSYEGK